MSFKFYFGLEIMVVSIMILLFLIISFSKKIKKYKKTKKDKKSKKTKKDKKSKKSKKGKKSKRIKHINEFDSTIELIQTGRDIIHSKKIENEINKEIFNNIGNMITHRHFANKILPHSNNPAAIFNGYTPSQLRTFYSIQNPPYIPKNKSIANVTIIIAYHYKNLKVDFSIFCKNSGLKSTNGSLTQVTLGTVSNSDWALEECLDLQMVFTANPNAQITVIEAVSNSYEDLFNAIRLATTGSITLNNKKYIVKPAQIISMSWGSQEFSGQNTLDSYFSHKNICFCASSGDENYVNYPASSPNVIAVGGTTLTLNNNIKLETTWSSAGCGISAYTPMPIYQSNFKTSKVNNRIIPDVSCIANPNYGVRIYYNGSWYMLGGTSVSAPLFAGMLSLANQKRLDSGKSTLISSSILNKNMIQNYIYKIVYPNAKLYRTIFYDVNSGINENYNADKGFDIPTGLGSPICQSLITELVNL